MGDLFYEWDRHDKRVDKWSKCVQEIEVTVPLKLTFDPGRDKNYLHMTIGDTVVNMSRGKGEKKKELGWTIACMGGGTEVKIGDYTWTMSAKGLWLAVQNRIEEIGEEEGLSK